jgi:hypothetical protein
MLKDKSEIQITLSEYIQTVGIDEVARLISTSPSTVKAWRYYTRTPRVKQAKILIQISNGILNWESIYGLVTDTNTDRAIR